MLMSKSCKPLYPGLFLLGAATALLVFAAPQTCAAALRQGLALCGGPLLVSLFPFFHPQPHPPVPGKGCKPPVLPCCAMGTKAPGQGRNAI